MINAKIGKYRSHDHAWVSGSKVDLKIQDAVFERLEITDASGEPIKKVVIRRRNIRSRTREGIFSEKTLGIQTRVSDTGVFTWGSTISKGTRLFFCVPGSGREYMHSFTGAKSATGIHQVRLPRGPTAPSLHFSISERLQSLKTVLSVGLTETGKLVAGTNAMEYDLFIPAASRDWVAHNVHPGKYKGRYHTREYPVGQFEVEVLKDGTTSVVLH